MFTAITQACRYLLNYYPGAEPVREYLNSRLEPESQEIFQFGYFPDVNELHLLTDLVGEELLYKHKILYRRGIEDSLHPRVVNFSYFEHYPLVMPFRDPYGNVAGLVGRTLFSNNDMKQRKVSKYKNTTPFKKGNYLFGLYENKQDIINQGSVYVVEGQFDVIKAVERGIKNIVAIGNNTMTPYQFSVISRYVNNIILLLDNDAAGEKGRQSVVDKFGQLANIQNFYIPKDYKDIDEYLTKENISDYADMSFVVKD